MADVPQFIKLSLQIIGNIEAAHLHWDAFFPGTPKPLRDVQNESLQNYSQRIGLLVRKAAVDYLDGVFYVLLLEKE
jgi:hypothetical protein